MRRRFEGVLCAALTASGVVLGGCGVDGNSGAAGSTTDDSGTPPSGSGGPSDATAGDAGSPPPSSPDGGTPPIHHPDAGADGTAPPSNDAGPPPYCPLGSTSGVVVDAGAGTGGAAETITLDGTGAGRSFDGIGAISGGGGNSRLLFDYPEPQRSDILDYLFRPGYGASLQILKVEIGGDTQSTDGAEPTHMHASGDLNCNRGYEWWLMEQAKARNPNIELYGLSWGAPGWFSGQSFWSQDNIDYHLAWLKCAAGHGLAIDYIGGWNEHGYDASWLEKFSTAIATAGYKTKIVCADQSDWGVGGDIAKDSAFKAACNVVGVHYPCGGDGASATSCPADTTSEGLGLPLWASENGSQDYNSGAPAMARAMNRGYIDAKMTSFIHWPLVAAILPGLSYGTVGLAVSNQPWTGWYDLGKQLWVAAHTTQFTGPGWQYIDSASGYLGGDRANGSYVTLKSTNGTDYSVIVETADATSPRTIALKAGGGLSTADPKIWATSLGSQSDADDFVHAVDLTGTAGTYWVTLQPNSVYTITTTTGQCKGKVTGPASSPSQPLPYKDDFESYAAGSLARIVSDMEGSFEVAACGGGRSGNCYRQMASVVPIGWGTPGAAFAILGTDDWADYTVTADVLLESAGSVELMGRFGGFNYFSDGDVNAYYLSVADTGAWSIYSNDGNGSHKTLASGTVAALGTNTWHTIAFSMKGSTLSGTVDGTSVGSANDGTYTAGGAGLSVGSASGSWLNAQFDNLSVTSP